MSTQPDISIIIPTYNLEEYVGATLESILLQQGVSLEVLVVDDGSSDNTVGVVQKYADTYPQIHLLHNEKSKGVSGARNTAMEHMQGKACFFLDGDDFLPPHALASLMQYMRSHKVPLVSGRMHFFCQQRWLWKEKIPQERPANAFPSEGFSQFLYDSSFLKEHGFHFPEGCTRGQDRAFFCQILCKHDDFPALETASYIYRINHKKSGLSAKQALSFMEHINHIRQYLENAQKLNFFPSYVQSQFCGFWLHYAYNTLQESPEAIENYLIACSALLSKYEEQLRPILLPELQEHSDAFWAACLQKDTQGMLTALQKTGRLLPPTPYMGISEKTLQNHWPFFRLLRRIKNICTMPHTLRHLYYIFSLERKAKNFCKKA